MMNTDYTPPADKSIHDLLYGDELREERDRVCQGFHTGFENRRLPRCAPAWSASAP